MPESVYVLDANVFIEAARRYYAFDLTPKFWELLVELAEQGKIISIDRVKIELDRGKDELARWANHDFHNAFAMADETDVIDSYGEIMNWVNGQDQFRDFAKAEFARGADGWVVAYAMAKEYTVVTQEVPDPHIRKRIPIPNVCQAFEVPFDDTFEMLRKLGVQWSR